MKKRFIYLFCLVFVLISCSQKDASISTADSQDVVVDTNSKVITRFIPASRGDIDKISLEVKRGISLCDCYKTKSLDFENVYAVACKVKYDVKVEGAEIAVGTWALGGRASINPIMSVGPVTSLISGWRNNPQLINIEDEGFREVSNYVRDLPSSCGN